MDNLKINLLGKSTVTRRKAAIEIKKNKLPGYATELLEALKMEFDKNHNATEIEIIKALGYLGNENAKSYIKENYINNDFFLADSCAAYLRINSTISDFIEILSEENYSKSRGTLDVLGYDKIIPTLEEQDKIITKCWNLGINRRKELGDPRYGLAAACAGWKSKMTKPFLLHCLNSGDVPLIYVSENSLKGKYVRLR
ncbi:hypothetical protein QSV08_15760 [Maribacter sp. BPC-D8]|uniref:hypothetical protein n=1 Tax=Maribacter sp. BPC-D8 TaxID=3053613 RepID=UPI002B45D1F9|nr:hypothetical protein [Maribacter sp. BPC-D8]WRI28672.1 hypothetical protein QSV08_15760 [Maribacter sp. BPC-D8]